CATQILRLTGDPMLRESIEWFVGELISLQAEDGYLGPWPKEFRLRRGGPTCAEPWDAWGHYHIMLGLLLWHESSGDARALACARRIADLLVRRFLRGTETLHGTGAQEMNQAPVHSLTMLYRLTGEPDYLALAQKIVEEFALPPAGDYHRLGLARVPFHTTPKPRWESLHPIMGLAELYYATGNGDYRTAFENLWWSMLEGDRHNNGGFSSGERANGNPYLLGAIETCCTVAWMAMSVEMLKLTGNPIVADELELSTFNSGIGMMSPTGRWVTYNTPMDGSKIASPNDATSFQARPGSAELNCCSVNGPRALGMLSDWALMSRSDGVALNYYGPGTMRTPLPSGNVLAIVQKTDYPRENRIETTVLLDRTESFALALRIPYWSQNSVVEINGERAPDVRPGQYLRLERRWATGDRIVIELDFRLRFWVNAQWTPNSDWQAQWRVFGPVANHEQPWQGADALPGEQAREMPESLTVNGKTLKPRSVVSDRGALDFRQLFAADMGAVGKAPIAIAFTEIEAERDDVLPIAFGADWWSCWSVNGEKVFDNHSLGGNVEPTGARVQRVDLPLRKGRNLVAVRVTSGTGGWSLTVGKGELKSQFDAQPESERFRQASIYRGPLLLACDPRFNADGDIPILEAAGLEVRRIEPDTWIPPWALFEFKTVHGERLRLCDFGSAGTTGNVYRSWLPVRFPSQPRSEFSRDNPLRTFTV
ncbi:MAG: glycoside hydrolase family 127 protein, partial [Kiritimatiellae bacterium]|nr:glycoside hydrolase family 127 protein [Kiritimatiellia bacterium]